MIQISGLASSEGSIHHVLMIQSEEVKIAKALTRLVHDLALICHYIANELAYILCDDLSCEDGLASEEAILVDAGWSHCYFLRILYKIAILHSNRQI